MIEITQVKIYPFETGDPFNSLRALADVTLADCLVIKGIKIIVSKNGGMFIGYPSRKGKDGDYHDMVIPKSTEFKSYLRSKVIEAYKDYQ